jgi:hypothetical protein
MARNANPRRDKSTDEITVYGHPPHNPEYAKLLYNKATRTAKVTDFLDHSSERDKIQFTTHFFDWYDMLTSYLSVSERLLLIIDNSVVQDIIHREAHVRRQPRYAALLALLTLAEDYLLLDVFACVTPTILYEAHRRVPFRKPAETLKASSIVSHAMASVGLDISFVGFNNVRDLIQCVADIREDEKTIFDAMRKIQTSNWKLDLPKSLGISVPLPLSIAERRVPDIRLRYFSVWHTKYVLMHAIVKEMYAVNEENKIFRGFCYQAMKHDISSILTTKSGRLKGLGDLELFSYCDLSTQTYNNSLQIAMAVTCDSNLHLALRKRMRTHARGISFRGGEDPSFFSTGWVYSMWREERNLKKINARQKKYGQRFVEFHDAVLKPYFPISEKDDDEKDIKADT